MALGREFGWLWTAHTVSACGTGLAFGAFPIVAVEVLHAGSAQVATLSAAGLAMGALLAVPLGGWMESRRKRPAMVATSLVRCAALLTVPVAHLAGVVTFAQLVVVSVVTAAGKIAFGAASGTYLRGILPSERLVAANARFETVTWSATIVGPPAGGALIGAFGPVVTLAVDAASYLLSALGVAMIRTPETAPRPGGMSGPDRAAVRGRGRDLVEGWRYVLAHPRLRPLLGNALLVNGLIMAAEAPLAVLMLGDLGFPAWQYGLAFAVPCLGGLAGARLAARTVSRFGERRVLRVVGSLRACWPLGLAFVGPGTAGLVTVITVELGLITCCGLFNPVLAACRLRATDAGRQARVLTAWSVSSTVVTAALTMVWGGVAELVGPRAAVALAGVLMLGTPALLLPGLREPGGGFSPASTGPAPPGARRGDG